MSYNQYSLVFFSFRHPKNALLLTLLLGLRIVEICYLPALLFPWVPAPQLLASFGKLADLSYLPICPPMVRTMFVDQFCYITSYVLFLSSRISRPW